MNRHVNAISGRLSLRPPQRQSLEILDRITEIVPPRKSTAVSEALELIQSEFPSVTDFERDFPSLCFALATGVGKTRLMGAFVTYLHLAHGINNFFILAPNLTIYNKLIADFTPNTPKYVFKGIAEFVVNGPAIITGDNYDQRDPASGSLFGDVRNQYFQHFQDRLGGARRQSAEDQAPLGIHRRKLLRLPRCPAGPRPADGRVPPLPRQGRTARHQRAEAGPRARTDRHALRRNGEGSDPLQQRHLRLRPGPRHRRWLRQGARRGDAKELQSRRHEQGGHRRAEALRWHSPARANQGPARNLCPRNQPRDRQALRAGDRSRHNARGATEDLAGVGRFLRRAATRTRSSRSIPARRGRKRRK